MNFATLIVATRYLSAQDFQVDAAIVSAPKAFDAGPRCTIPPRRINDLRKIAVKLDQRTAQSLIKAAMRERHAPGKYDVFAWTSGTELLAITVAWKSFTRRSVAVESTPLKDGDEVQTNAAPLPNGVDRNAAQYVGSFRIDKRLAPDEP